MAAWAKCAMVRQIRAALGRARFAFPSLWERYGHCTWMHPPGPLRQDSRRLDGGVLQYRPYPRAGYRLRVKAGAFHAPVSLENRAPGWDSPYTLSYSALNSWLGEELRTIGLEAQLDWLGTRTGHGFDLG